MNNIVKYLLAVVCAVLWTTGCHEDEGTDWKDYRPISDIKLEGLEDAKSCIMGETLSLPLTVTSEYSEESLRYTWFMYINQLDMTNVTVDTISHDKNLNYVVTEEPGAYTLGVKVENVDNGYAVFGTTTLNVGTEFSRGFYVLKATVDGNTDLDFYSSKGELIPDIITRFTGEPAQGKPRVLSQLLDYPYVDPETAERKMDYVLGITTEAEARLMLLRDMSLIYNYEQMFLGEGNKGKPGRFVRTHGYTYYISADGAYSIKTQGLAYGMGRYGYPASITGGGSKGTLAYASQESGLFGALPGFLYFDEVNGRFLRTHDTYGVVSFTGSGEISPNGITGKLLFMGPSRTTGGTMVENIYAVFETAVSERKLYVLNGGAEANLGNPVTRVETIGADKMFSQATCYASKHWGGMHIWFVAEGRLYHFDPSAQTETLLSPQGLPAGQAITYVGNRFWGITKGDSDMFNYLLVGTSDGTNYTLSMYNMVGGSPTACP